MDADASGATLSNPQSLFLSTKMSPTCIGTAQAILDHISNEGSKELVDTFKHNNCKPIIYAKDVISLLQCHNQKHVCEFQQKPWKHCIDNAVQGFREMSLSIETLVLRDYQQQGVRALVTHEFAYCGTLWWACGSGKTAAAVAAVVLLQKKTLAVFVNTTSIYDFLNYLERCGIQKSQCLYPKPEDHGSHIKLFDVWNADIVLVTYAQLRHERVSEMLFSVLFGVLLLDEAHAHLAIQTQGILKKVLRMVQWMLTATPNRRDEQDVLKYAPIVHTVGVTELVDQGYLALVHRVLLVVPYTPAHAALNMHKIPILVELLKHHTKRGDDCLVFVTDPIEALNHVRNLAYDILYQDTGVEPHMPHAIHGGVSMVERHKLYRWMQQDNVVGEQGKILFVSAVAEEALNCPALSVVIALNTSTKSLRPEVQMYGRVQRPRKDKEALFYRIAQRRGDNCNELRFAKRRMVAAAQGPRDVDNYSCVQEIHFDELYNIVERRHTGPEGRNTAETALAGMRRYQCCASNRNIHACLQHMSQEPKFFRKRLTQNSAKSGSNASDSADAESDEAESSEAESSEAESLEAESLEAESSEAESSEAESSEVKLDKAVEHCLVESDDMHTGKRAAACVSSNGNDGMKSRHRLASGATAPSWVPNLGLNSSDDGSDFSE